MSNKERLQGIIRLKSTLLSRGVNEDWINTLLTDLMSYFNYTQLEIREESEKDIRDYIINSIDRMEE